MTLERLRQAKKPCPCAPGIGFPCQLCWYTEGVWDQCKPECENCHGEGTVPAFPSLWRPCDSPEHDRCGACEVCGFLSDDEPICHTCNDALEVPRDFRDPIETVGPVLRDYHLAAENLWPAPEARDLWDVDPQEVIVSAEAACVSLGWLQPEQEAEDA